MAVELKSFIFLLAVGRVTSQLPEVTPMPSVSARGNLFRLNNSHTLYFSDFYRLEKAVHVQGTQAIGSF